MTPYLYKCIYLKGEPFSCHKIYKVSNKNLENIKKEIATQLSSITILKKYFEKGLFTLKFQFFTTSAKKDLDNMMKFYIDRLTGLLYQDDSQVHYIEAEKTVVSEYPLAIIKYTIIKK